MFHFLNLFLKNISLHNYDQSTQFFLISRGLCVIHMRDFYSFVWTFGVSRIIMSFGSLYWRSPHFVKTFLTGHDNNSDFRSTVRLQVVRGLWTGKLEFHQTYIPEPVERTLRWSTAYGFTILVCSMDQSYQPEIHANHQCPHIYVWPTRDSQISSSLSLKYPGISNHFLSFLATFSNFQQFSSLSSHLSHVKPFPAISSHFLPFQPF